MRGQQKRDEGRVGTGLQPALDREVFGNRTSKAKKASTGVRWCSKTDGELQYNAAPFIELLRAENADLRQRAVGLALEIQELKARKQT